MIIAVGDIHGCKNELEKLFFEIKVKKPSLTIFLGDYVDRGPDVKGTIDSMLEYASENKSIFLLGNHDDMARSMLFNDKRYKRDIWRKQGAEQTLKSLAGFYDENISDYSKYVKYIDEKYLNFLKKLNTIYYIKNDYIFVHAGIRDFNKDIENQDEDYEINIIEDPKDIYHSYVWERNTFFSHKNKYKNYIIVHGHTPTVALDRWGFEITEEDYNKPFFRKNDNDELISIDVDTGAVYGYSLSAILIEEGKFETISIKV